MSIGRDLADAWHGVPSATHPVGSVAASGPARTQRPADLGPTGLTRVEVARRTTTYGANVVAPPRPRRLPGRSCVS
jgi:hypothetical protein